jgi:hypothetical protein
MPTWRSEWNIALDGTCDRAEVEPGHQRAAGLLKGSTQLVGEVYSRLSVAHMVVAEDAGWQGTVWCGVPGE